MRIEKERVLLVGIADLLLRGFTVDFERRICSVVLICSFDTVDELPTVVYWRCCEALALSCKSTSVSDLPDILQVTSCGYAAFLRDLSRGSFVGRMGRVFDSSNNKGLV